MVTDVHAHIMTHNIDGHKRNLLNVSQRFGVDRYYISTIDGSECPDEATIDFDNKVTFDFMKEQPELIKGYVYINPRNANALDVLKKGIEEQGMSGVKLWIDPEVTDFYAFTKDSLKLEGYQGHPLDAKLIPVAV